LCTPDARLQSGPTEDDDAREQASLFLQRLLRGRAAQNDMFLGKVRARPSCGMVPGPV
jgi:hypothetical protein